jgi:hypothetical protein
MDVYGYYYENSEIKNLYVIEKKGLYFLTDNLDIKEWFVSKKALL